MSRRISLPGADELFRSTGVAAGEPEPAEELPEPRALRPLAAPASSDTAAPYAWPAAPELPSDPAPLDPEPGAARRARSRPRSVGDRRPSGRERHDEKITVYVSPSELMDLEQARLTLRGDFGLAVDRGRIVREALAVVLADLEAKGESSILVRRLLGR